LAWKEILGLVAIALTFAAFAPYVRSVLRGETKPHVFSWVLWGIATIVVFAAQLTDGGGAGAWPIGVSGCITLCVAVLAYTRRADIAITRLDWLFLSVGLAALPIWLLTSNPFWAVALLTVIDCLGFGPTLRKSYNQPFDEALSFYAFIGLRNFVAIAALEHYSPTTLLFPAVMGAASIAYIAMVLVRRKMLSGDRQ
jgi:hypothetical protein